MTKRQISQPVILETTNNTKPCLVQTSQGFSILYQNKYLYSKYNPSRTITENIASLTVLPGTLFLCCSPVLMYGLKELTQKLKENCFILACELEDELYSFSLSQNDYNALNNFSWLTKNEAIHLPELLQKDSYTLKSGISLPKAGTFKRVVRIDFSAGTSFNESLYNEIYSYSVNSIMTFWKNRITLTRFGRKYSLDLFNNLKILGETTPLGAYFSKIEKPLVLFGAGESTEEGIKQIKENQNNYFILCADTALPPLVKAGIKPDGVFLEEAQSVILNAFTGVLGNDIHFYASLSSVPQLSHLTDKKQISFFTSVYADSPFLNELINRDFMPPANPPFGSVGLTMVYYALKFRKDTSIPVYIYGLDFSYSVGKTHANGTPAHKRVLLKSNRLLPPHNISSAFSNTSSSEKGKNNKSVITDPLLKSYRDLFNNYFQNETNLFDSSDSGLKLSIPAKKPEAPSTTQPEKMPADSESFTQKQKDEIKNYLENEKKSLIKIRDILTGKIKV